MSAQEWLYAYRFFVTIGNLKASFQKINNIGERMEPEYIHEGGRLYSYPLKSAKGVTGKLIFEKGHGTTNPFYKNKGFTIGMYINSPCSIILMDDFKTPKRIFAFDGGMILSWETTPLDAQSGDLLIDKIEIGHAGLYEV